MHPTSPKPKRQLIKHTGSGGNVGTRSGRSSNVSQLRRRISSPRPTWSRSTSLLVAPFRFVCAFAEPMMLRRTSEKKGPSYLVLIFRSCSSWSSPWTTKNERMSWNKQVTSSVCSLIFFNLDRTLVLPDLEYVVWTLIARGTTCGQFFIGPRHLWLSDDPMQIK
jgi:hypothetical protein